MAQTTTEKTPRRAPPGRMTYEEFLAWCDEDTWAEWVDGEVVILSPASARHQDLARFLLIVLGLFVEAHELGIVLPAPFQMKLGPAGPGRGPDLLFVARAHLDRLRPTHLDGPADLVVEITSPESISRDRGEKYVEYEAAGIPEYWLLDPFRKQAEFYLLGEDGIYRLAPVGEDGIFRSRVLEGLWLRVDWLWQEPLPPLMDVLRQWRLI